MSASEPAVIYAEPAWASAPEGVFRPGGLALTDHALALCDLPAGARVLDVGCGSAVVCAHLWDRHRLAAFGLDPSVALLKTGRRRTPDLPLIRAVGEQLPVAAESLDLVLAECSLSLVDDPGRILAEFRRALKPGGWLILSDVYARSAACPGSAWTEREVQMLIHACRLVLTRWEDHSAALKVFAAQWLFTHGTLPPLGCAPAPARLGYFLLTARRS